MISRAMMVAAGLVFLASVVVQLPAGAQGAASDARSAAPIDLEGYWISVVTEDWRWRMVTPPKGDYASVPLNPEGVRVADTWQPGDGEGSCLPYGAPNVMRMPLRVHITWADADTLQVQTDHGMQTRRFLFRPSAEPAAPSRQGYSVASFDGSALKVVTSHLLPGWLRRNGVSYSASAEVTEYYNAHTAFGDTGFTVTTIVHDPVYLDTDFVTSSTFRKLPDDSGWLPTPCDESEQG